MNNSIQSNACRRVIVLYNPFAGNGRAEKTAQLASRFVHQKSWLLVDCISSSYAGEIENKLATRAAHQADLVILIGGDGTLRELVSGLQKHEQRPEIAFIPMGNANVVARELNIPLNPIEALHLLDNSVAIQVDIGRVNSKQSDKQARSQIFLAMLEIGMGAKIVHMVNALRLGKLKRLYQLWGDLVYAFAGLMAFAGKPLSQVRGTLLKDEHSIETAITSSHLVIANMRTYAKGWSFTPDADCRDGQLDLAWSNRTSRLVELGGFIAAANKRKRSSRLMHYASGREIRLHTTSQLYIQIDGDPVSLEGQTLISVLPKAFTIHVPRDKRLD